MFREVEDSTLKESLGFSRSSRSGSSHRTIKSTHNRKHDYVLSSAWQSHQRFVSASLTLPPLSLTGFSGLYLLRWRDKGTKWWASSSWTNDTHSLAITLTNRNPTSRRRTILVRADSDAARRSIAQGMATNSPLQSPLLWEDDADLITPNSFMSKENQRGSGP